MRFDRRVRNVGLVLWFSFEAVTASAQSQTDVATAPKITMQNPLDQSGTGIVRDALGRPCLDVEAAARRQTINPQMLDHVVSIKNNCPKSIKAKVCYFNSDRCNNVDLRPYSRADTILGTMNGISFFRYTISQK